MSRNAKDKLCRIGSNFGDFLNGTGQDKTGIVVALGQVDLRRGAAEAEGEHADADFPEIPPELLAQMNQSKRG
ncbi:MAG: hypothetical protein ACOYJ6_17740 [Caulobacterales bacterium]|jgi:hypothetical protein